MTEIIRNMPAEEYRKRPGINATILKCVYLYSLQHAKAQLDGVKERTSDALDFGNAFHSLLLENETRYVVHPDTYPAPKHHDKVKKGDIQEGDPLPWNANAAICKTWIAEQNGATVLDSQEDSELRGMVEGVRRNEEIAEYLNGDTEVSIFTEYKGVPVKARVDLLPKERVVIDFKKAKSANPDKFTKQATTDLAYHMQGAWNLDVLRWAGIERKSFWLVAVEQERPHVASIVKFDDVPISFLRAGRRLCRAAFQRLVNANQTGRWPGYETSHAEEWAKPWQQAELETT
jgi:hypothetical protein